MNYRFHKHFVKSYRKLSVKLQKAVDQKLLLFSMEPFSVSLNNHLLAGHYKNYRSINITGDYRAIYKQITEEDVIFAKLGTHSQLYKG